MVTMTMVAGEVLMKEGVLLTLDEAEITENSRQLASQAWQRYQSNVPAD